MSFVFRLILMVVCWLCATSASADPTSIRLAVEGETVKLEASTPFVDAHTPFAIASIGKTFTAVAVLRMVERGELSLDAKVADALPALARGLLGDMSDMRLRHLLTMSSGLPDYYTDDWLDDALANPAQFQSIVAALQSVALEQALFQPGSAFNYSNTDYLLLGLILEAVSGMTYAEVIRGEILLPLGMEDSFVFGSAPLPADFARDHKDRALVRRYFAGSGFGDGGIIASAHDVAVFYTALFGHRSLLSEAGLRLMMRDPFSQGYGMGIEIQDGLVGHSGGDVGYSSDVRMNLESGDIAVMLIAEEDAETDWPRDWLNTR